MIEIRKSEDRGRANHGWLQAKHTFSFANYYDPKFLGFRDLLVINDDEISRGSGFATHPHKDMEIITYVYEGSLKHKDSEGHEMILNKGEVQRMSAGRGIRHSEMNPSHENETKLLQIWIQTQKEGIDPSYEQKKFQTNTEALTLAVSSDGEKESLKIHQQVKLWVGNFSEKTKLSQVLKLGHAWVQIVKGDITVNGMNAKTGDGLAISNEENLEFSINQESEFILIELR